MHFAVSCRRVKIEQLHIELPWAVMRGLLYTLMADVDFGLVVLGRVPLVIW